MDSSAPISFERVNHYFGEGELRRQVLRGVSGEIDAGEIVIVTGPSGSGKTTLLTLIGALRSTQEGSLRVLGNELRGASAHALEKVRQQVGYIFQAHNLIAALTAGQNVELGVLAHGRPTATEARQRAAEVLKSVGLGDRVDSHPESLSGGQRQRVAIARALAGRPRIILADEPTASLDRRTGREVVDLMRDLAKKDGVTVLLVTHDQRILDVADRILHLEDGQLASLTEAVMSNTQEMMRLVAHTNRRGELVRKIQDLPTGAFVELLDKVTREAEEFLRVIEVSHSLAFESMLEQALAAFTFKLADVLCAERASLFLVDRQREELWLRVAQEEGGRSVEQRLPLGSGIAGYVARTGESVIVDDAYADPRFNPAVDKKTGFRTRRILCIPVRDRDGNIFAVAQLLNRLDGACFTQADVESFEKFIEPLGILLLTWWKMSHRATGEQRA